MVSTSCSGETPAARSFKNGGTSSGGRKVGLTGLVDELEVNGSPLGDVVDVSERRIGRNSAGPVGLLDISEEHIYLLGGRCDPLCWLREHAGVF